LAIATAVIAALALCVHPAVAQPSDLTPKDILLTALSDLNGSLADEQGEVGDAIALVGSKKPLSKIHHKLKGHLQELQFFDTESYVNLGPVLDGIPDVWNIPYATHFHWLDCIDYQLVLSVEDVNGDLSTNPDATRSEERVIGRYGRAQTCIEKFRKALTDKGQGVPKEFTDGLGNIDAKLEGAKFDLEKMGASEFRTSGAQEVRKRARELAAEKAKLIAATFPTVFGLKPAYVFVHLFTVNSEIKAVHADSKDALTMLESNPTDRAALDHLLHRAKQELDNAKAQKDQLESNLSTCPSTKGTRAAVASACPAPPCRPGAFTSAPLQVTAPSQPQGAQYYFTTPIPNWLYYQGKHGFKSGGCNHEQGKVKVNIEVLNAANKPIAWNLEYGPGISPGLGQPPVMVYSGNACPFVQSGQTFDGCRIDNPELAYPLPSEGYIGTVNGDASNDPFYAATIDVHPAAMVGSTDTVHVLVTWQLA
jgi:hypothetical protein